MIVCQHGNHQACCGECFEPKKSAAPAVSDSFGKWRRNVYPWDGPGEDYTENDMRAAWEAGGARQAQRALELEAVLAALVKANEEWNAAVQTIIGRPPGWTDGYLDRARAVLGREK